MNKPLLTLGISLALSVPLLAQAGPKEDFNQLYSRPKAPIRKPEHSSGR